ncbi:B-cadherin-like [Triplophysa rosa]|uniref:Cadherin-1 n=1 Tax=Triplophysa rosa TaxID=992332 RepID=A0A9W7TTU6_TRIRA|nr:B-cadherin-like [Triplophysa rosa]KAI7802358.1 putative B-cadherin [Triplophysa rosa]
MMGYSNLGFICVLSLVKTTPQFAAVIEQNATTPRTQSVFLMKIFPKASAGLIRRKREWMIPAVNIPENDKGPFPKEVVKMKSTAADLMKMVYYVTGPGADQPPVGLFKVHRHSGMLSVTDKLDREETKEYILTIHGSAESENYIEKPAEIIINIIDQNDNAPVCTHNPFRGEVPERSKPNVFVVQVSAKDLDDPNTFNGIVRYKLVGQEPSGDAFHIDPVTGNISLASFGILDRETYPLYKLHVEAADLEGRGFSSTCMVIIKVTDSNDHAPRFSQNIYIGTMQEHKVGEIVARLTVTDKDETLTANSMVKFTIIDGNEEGVFNVSTAPNKMEGIITTIKGLDFEQGRNTFSLLVVVENTVPFAVPLSTSTATVTITVQDVNEPPIFELAKKQVRVAEDLPVGSSITNYTAKDPDTARQQNIRYKMPKDIAKWLEITEDTGQIKVRNPMDREASFLKNGEYTVLIEAYDNDDEPATGTGTLIIHLKDVNDNAPVLEQPRAQMCSTEPEPVQLTITDQDGPENSLPFHVELHNEYQNNWTVINSSGDAVWLYPLRHLDVGEYRLLLRVYDSQMLFLDNSVTVEMCDCKGRDVICLAGVRAAYVSTLYIYVLAAVFCLLLLLLLLLFLKRKSWKKQKLFIQTDDNDRDNILCYNEEGGGEEDQDYVMSLLHSGPQVFNTNITPTDFFYRQHCEDNEDIGNFINNNLYTAVDDHRLAPRDSLLVFGYEGEGSSAGSLSSLHSSSSDGSQDYQHLQQWGSPFTRLADMYKGDDE